MSKQKVFLTVLGLAFFLTASSAFAVGPYCESACSCSASCSTACYGYPAPFTGDTGKGGNANLVPPRITCGDWGLCIATCPGCNNLSCTSYVYGTSGNDTLNGTSSRECIYSYGGNDTIDGNAGDDRIYGSYGTDTIWGDSGNDCLWGGDDDDYLDGGSGDDFVDGGAGYDTCYAEVKVNCP